MLASRGFPKRLDHAIELRETTHNQVRKALQKVDVQGRASLTYQHYKHGKVSPPLEATEAISAILNVDTCWLAFGKGQP